MKCKKNAFHVTARLRMISKSISGTRLAHLMQHMSQPAKHPHPPPIHHDDSHETSTSPPTHPPSSPEPSQTTPTNSNPHPIKQTDWKWYLILWPVPNQFADLGASNVCVSVLSVWESMWVVCVSTYVFAVVLVTLSSAQCRDKLTRRIWTLIPS